MEPTRRVEERPDGTLYTPEKVDGLEFLRTWKRLNAYEHDDIVEKQAQAKADADAAEAGEEIRGYEEVPPQDQEKPTPRRSPYTHSTDIERDPFQQQQEQETTSSSTDQHRQTPQAWAEMTRSE